MTLLEFARGPALQWSLIIFVAGVVWRVVGSALLLRHKDLSQPRGGRAPWLREILMAEQQGASHHAPNHTGDKYDQ